MLNMRLVRLRRGAAAPGIPPRIDGSPDGSNEYGKAPDLAPREAGLPPMDGSGTINNAPIDLMPLSRSIMKASTSISCARLILLLLCAAHTNALCQTNSWTNPASAKWEE